MLTDSRKKQNNALVVLNCGLNITGCHVVFVWASIRRVAASRIRQLISRYELFVLDGRAARQFCKHAG
jgi:hypothetical protein